MKTKGLLVLIIVGIVLGIGVAWFSADIGAKKSESVAIKTENSQGLSDDNPDFAVWGARFPDYLDMYLKMKDSTYTATEFAGSYPYSKINRYPQLTMFWDGYAFKYDYNQNRSHYYSQIDQMDTLRNNKEYLNSHGLKAFDGQPGACMNCHTGNLQNLVKKFGWIEFNTMKYWTIIKMMEGPNTVHGKKMGSTCADCHNPDDMSLRVTRPAAIKAFIARGYEGDEKHGIKADRQEMRSLVCMQCHVEYYNQPTGKKVTVKAETKYQEIPELREGNKIIEVQADGIELTYPWKFWKKGEPFRIEMFDDYYESVRDSFPYDFIHASTKAPILKMQHPEAELYSGSVHAANGVSCADCHMPYTRKGAKKVTNHFIASPLLDVNASCKSCHTQSEDYLKNQVKDIQRMVAANIRSAEYAVASLIQDITTLRSEMLKLQEFAKIADKKQQEMEITKILTPALELHRKSQMRADFMNAENSSGFHNPRESNRIALQAVKYAKDGQNEVLAIAMKYGIKMQASKLGFEDMRKIAPKPSEVNNKRYYESPLQDDAPKDLLKLDKNLVPYNYKAFSNQK
ncbi:ammonia-forming cytochrome c nitrite reductase subunit c552 [Helicobacter sp. faydin-H20]|uniref:ammonia-forming cytochrome c nitrite reductase subunit c552 n=1 Tax=Helicobacter anatolicus TaxID=2905874 RepID=UPI001E5FF181|nr:ammonia-forming cytochrome c nitrite reductase subunit c552 [Helicobacter anatolicus]MCE3037590.1 ammonia-forming cytochrome c nitrite reductase subunit c552 [Helicobacter anatolicus]